MVKREDFRPVYLIYGSNPYAEMTSREEFEELAQSDKLNFTFVPVLNDPGEEWAGETGFISADLLAI